MTKNLLMGAAGAAVLAACVGAERTDAETTEAASPARGYEMPAGDVAMNPSDWASAELPTRPGDAVIEERVEALLARMTLEEKVGQILQPEVSSITPDEVREYDIGSVLNGGNARPNGDPYAGVDDWLAMADGYFAASVDDADGGVAIPIVWGTDSVHGNNSLFGATIFPHNIGLGAANDPALMAEIGRVTAVETSAMGADWTFAPAVSVARDDRWGRTYESYSEDPEIASRLGSAYIQGLQGEAGTEGAFGPGAVLATAKHFIADGGTANGRDQGDARVDEATLREVHYPPYVAAVEAGAQTVMASYSEWNGVRMHGHGPLLTGVLKDRMGFDGFVVGDYNGHGLIEGCTNTDCPDALLAGVDMYMIPAEWRGLRETLLSQVEEGLIPMARLDDAVRRILRVKARAGLLDAPKPSERPFAGAGSVGTEAHRDLARRAARQSLVLLKNDGALPIAPDATVLVTGDGADSVPKLVGGWSMNWQGAGLSNDDFPTGASVLEAVRAALEAGGGRAVTDEAATAAPDAAIVVFGEDPYAEFQGDRESVLYSVAEDDPDLARMRELRARGVPVVGVFVSGRPMWINPHINASDAMIAAFLPGTEGGRAIGDLLIQDRDDPAYDFTGGLSFSWPRTAAQTDQNAGTAGYDPLFPLGYGLSYEVETSPNPLSEDPALTETMAAAVESSVFFEAGRALVPWRVFVSDAAAGQLKTEGDRLVTSPTGAIAYESNDRRRQEDTKRITWSGQGEASVFIVGFDPVDFTRQANAAQALVMEAKVVTPPQAPATLTVGSGDARASVDVGRLFAAPGDYATVSVPLSCFAGEVDFGSVDRPFELRTDGAFEIVLADLRLGQPEGEVLDCKV